MRKLFLTTALFFASLGFVFSQTFSSPPCVIAANDTGLITPYYDSLHCIERGLSYTSAVQLSFPAIFNGVVQLDSLVITSITGFPAGIAYQQNPASGVYYADSNGCIAFAGSTNDTVGAYQLTFNGYAVVTTQSSGTQTYSLAQLAQIQDAPVPVYYLNIINQGDSCFPQPIVEGIPNLIRSSQLNVYPNPTTGVFNLQLNAGMLLNGNVVVTDITGRTVYSQLFSTAGIYNNAIDLTHCAKGYYTLQLKTSAGIVSKSIAIQ